METFTIKNGMNIGLSQTLIDNLNPSDGDLVYNTTTDKLQVYYSGQWNDKN